MAAISDAERSAMERNLRILPWWWVARWIWLGEAIWVIYLLRERGLTIGEVIVFDSVLAAIALAAELPTGIVADRYGRRISLFLACLATSVAFLGFGLAQTIPLLLGSYALFAIADAFMSGADNALLFDTLQRLGRGDEFTRRLGRMGGAQTAAIAVLTVIGGLMIRWTPLGWPIVLSGFLSIPGVFLALMLKEPPHEGERLSFMETGRSAARRVIRTPSMRGMIMLATFSVISIVIMSILIQPVVDYGVPLWMLGLFSGTQMALSAAGAWSAASVGRRLGLRRTMQTMAMLSALALFGGASGVIWLFPVFILPSVTFNVIHPHFADYISRRSPERERATTLSLGTLTERLVMIPATLLLAVAVDAWGMHTALALAAGVLFTLVVLAYLEWARSGDTEIEPTAPLDEHPAAEPPSRIMPS
jgi:MFS family permease